MTPLRLLIALLILGGIAAAVWMLGADSDADVGAYLDPTTPVVRLDPKTGPRLEILPSTAVPDSGTSGEQRVETPLPGGRLTLEFFDRESGQPVAGAVVMRVRDGQVLGTADDAGCVAVPAGRINRMVFAAPGYLLSHFFDRPARALALARQARDAGHVRIPLWADMLMTHCQLRFVDPGGKAARGVRFRIRCVEDEVPDMRTVPGGRLGAGASIPPSLRGAWQRHVLLGSMPRPRFGAGAVLHLGAWSDRFEHRADDQVTLRCLLPGSYLIEASSPAGFRRQRFDVQQGGTVTIRLREGGVLRGRVVAGPDAQPVDMAGVSLKLNGAVQASALTEADGVFELGPLPTVAMELEIHHPDFAPFTQGAVRPGGPSADFTLRARPKHAVRGRVSRRPDQLPIAGAVVRVLVGARPVEEARTDAEGRFQLMTHVVEPTLEIEKTGFLTYAESFNANGVVRQFSLIPAAPSERVRLGLTGMVSGQVFDREGKPAAQRRVRAEAQEPGGNRGLDARRILRGGAVPAQEVVTTDAAGRYELEWPRAVTLNLVAPRPGQVSEPIEKSITIVLGQRQELVFRDPR